MWMNLNQSQIHKEQAQVLDRMWETVLDPDDMMQQMHLHYGNSLKNNSYEQEI